MQVFTFYYFAVLILLVVKQIRSLRKKYNILHHGAGWTVFPRIHVHPEPQNRTVFGNRVFADVIN